MDTKNIIKEYSNGEVTVVWKPAVCIHSTICWRGVNGLIEVFNPKERPWIKMDGADTDRIVEQVKKCPSGALSFYLNKTEDKQSSSSIEALSTELF